MSMQQQQQTTDSPAGVDIGIPYMSSKPQHLMNFYAARAQLGTMIKEHASADDIRTYVEYMASAIPDAEQYRICVMMIDEKYEEELQKLLEKANNKNPTQNQIERATKSACMAVAEAITLIMDDDLGIRKRIMVGTI